MVDVEELPRQLAEAVARKDYEEAARIDELIKKHAACDVLQGRA